MSWNQRVLCWLVNIINFNVLKRAQSGTTHTQVMLLLPRLLLLPQLLLLDSQPHSTGWLHYLLLYWDFWSEKFPSSPEDKKYLWSTSLVVLTADSQSPWLLFDGRRFHVCNGKNCANLPYRCYNHCCTQLYKVPKPNWATMQWLYIQKKYDVCKYFILEDFSVSSLDSRVYRYICTP